MRGNRTKPRMRNPKMLKNKGIILVSVVGLVER